MIIKLLKFMLAFVLTMVAPTGIIVVAIFLFQVDVDAVFKNYPIAISIGFGAYGAFVIYAYFGLQDVFIVFKPKPDVKPVPKNELISRLEKGFTQEVDGKKIFEFAKKNNAVAITWAASMEYYQVVSGGKKSMKRVIVLKFDEKNHDIYFLMHNKNSEWNLSTTRFNVSMSFSTGIFAEVEATYVPSITYSEDGKLGVDMKSLKYNSMELWRPIEAAALSSGWTLRGGMMPNKILRVFVSLLGGAFFYGIMYLITMIGRGG